MKCPKCGYNSFEFLDSCKKCSSDLVAFKGSHGIRAVILPFRLPAEAVSSPEMGDSSAPVTDMINAPESEDLFSWDTPSETEPSVKSEEALFGAGFSETAEGKGAEPFKFDLEPLPEPPIEEPQGVEETVGEFSFEEIGGENREQTQETGAAGNPFTEESLSDMLESTPTVGGPLEESGPALSAELAPADAGNPFAEESLADLLESGPFADSQPEEAVTAITGELAPTDAGNPFVEESLADLLESGPFAGGQLEKAGAATAEEFASGELREFEESAPQEGPLAVLNSETAAPVEEFDFENFFLEEEDAAPAEPVKGAAIDSLGLSKDEFDSLFGEAADAEKESAAG